MNKKVLLIEDDEDVFEEYSISYENMGYDVFPSSYEEYENISNFNELVALVKEKTIFEKIDFISIDLNLNGFELLEPTTTNPFKEQLGIELLKKIVNSEVFPIRTIPILIISQFEQSDIDKAHKISQFTIDYIYKDNLDKDEEFPLKGYFERNKTKDNIKKKINLYRHFLNKEYEELFQEKLNLEHVNILINSIKEQNNSSLVPYYQKICDEKEKTIKYEVLARIKKNEEVENIFKYLNEAKFFGLLSFITKKMVEKSLSKCHNNIHLSFNLDYLDLKKANIDKLTNFLQETIQKYGFQKEHITLEILEGVRHNQEIEDSIQQLHDHGYKIAIDDFGVENSNFKRLKSLISKKCIDIVKIDGEFIKDYNSNSISQTILKGIIEAITDDIVIVVEYVANEDLFNQLKNDHVRINQYQGYYFGEPKYKVEK